MKYVWVLLAEMVNSDDFCVCVRLEWSGVAETRHEKGQGEWGKRKLETALEERNLAVQQSINLRASSTCSCGGKKGISLCSF